MAMSNTAYDLSFIHKGYSLCIPATKRHHPDNRKPGFIDAHSHGSYQPTHVFKPGVNMICQRGPFFCSAHCTSQLMYLVVVRGQQACIIGTQVTHHLLNAVTRPHILSCLFCTHTHSRTMTTPCMHVSSSWMLTSLHTYYTSTTMPNIILGNYPSTWVNLNPSW